MIWSFYGRTGASSEQDPHSWNDSVLEAIFEISAQFGDIPIIIAGDFQAEPLSYSSVTQAIHFAKWEDPFVSFDAEGLPKRQLTFSTDRSFSGQEGCSCIDTILINHVTCSALVSFETVQSFETQHRPLRIECHWQRIFMTGFVHHKTAPFLFDPTNAPDHPPGFTNDHADALWTDRYAQAFDESADPDVRWSIANDFCSSFMLQNGGQWGDGLRERGQPPKFRSKRVCPGQSAFGGASKSKMAILCKAFRVLQELFFRLSRQQGSLADTQVSYNTCCNAHKLLTRLRSPLVWSKHSIPTVLQVWSNLQWIGDLARNHDVRTKLDRIQRWRNKIRADAQTGNAFIFRHLRNRANDEPANLLQDDQGNIIVDPTQCQAIDTFNNAWDEVFACNIAAEHPLKMLEVIWPYIKDHTKQFECPPIDAHELWLTVQARKPQAAPGFDGWRTQELQKLPEACFKPFAEVFAQLELTDEPLPTTLTCARQMILNKNGSAHPMQKRLITVLPILYLAYSGARFRQLRTWQIQSMPRQLVGGVQGRNMSCIQTHLKLDIDVAESQGFDLIGLKLDKAKCFDRVIPSFAATLMLAFGIDRKLVSIFTKLYDGLHRHLSFKCWCSPVATHAANGIAQGDSMSLVAINVYSKVWIIFMDLLPDVVAMAYIDDCYLWARLEHASALERAVQTTRFWDQLSGQLLNDSKCVVWGTSTSARRTCKALWPDMSLQLEIEVLGATIPTSKRLAFHFPESKTQAIVKEIKHIKALPLSAQMKSFFIGVKVIPRFCFAASLNQMPKEIIKRIQSEIVQTIWGRRPHWRARALVMAFIAKPHQNDPQCARAYHTILEFVRFLRMPGNGLDKVCWCASPSPHEHSFVNRIQQAFAFFGFQLSDTLRISFAGKDLMPVWDLTPKDIKPLHQRFARHKCYLDAANQHRKDFRMPTGILDFDLTCGLRKSSQLQMSSDVPVESHFQSQLVGCTLTRDRLFAASLDSSDKCRFCEGVKESLSHLVHDCPVFLDRFPPHPIHEYGPNFGLLGIVEHPIGVVKHRLGWSDPAQVPERDFHSDAPHAEWWSDGSIFWSDIFWLTSGGFSIVDQNHHEVFGGPVYNLSLSSYSTELWAIVVAIRSCTGPTTVYTDCQTVVNQFQELQLNKSPDPSWSHLAWWQAIHDRLTELSQLHQVPFQAVWIPSHLFEHLPEEYITESMARSKGTEVRHIMGNRFADRFAKDHALECTSVHPKDESMLKKSIIQRQDWLANLNMQVAVLQKQDLDMKMEARLEAEAESENVYSLFPHWEWDLTADSFPWKPGVSVLSVPLHDKWKERGPSWRVLGSFFDNLQWRLHGSALTSYVELAVLFYLRGFLLPEHDPEQNTFRDLTGEIRQFVAHIRLVSDAIVPGVHNRHRNKSIGKSLPNGTIDGAEVYFTKAEKIRFAQILSGVSTARLSAWEFTFGSAES